MKGRVICSTGNWYEVETDDARIFACKVKGNFRLKGMKTTNPVAVGDWVEIEHDPKISSGNEMPGGWITAIEERKNCIIRKSVNLSKQTHIIAANIDRAFLVAGLTQPRTPQGFLDRFLVTAEAYHVPVCLVFNKSDLFDTDIQSEYEEYSRIYQNIGYPVLKTSSVDGDGIKQLKEMMDGKTCLFAGNSGVGKSALIHCLAPELDIRIGEISQTHLKGKHTTTYARMYKLWDNTAIIDTPGVKEFGMVRFTQDELALYFPEMKELLPDCRFSNCTHEHEPGCAVKEAVEKGWVSSLRYRSYLNILHGDEVPAPSLLDNKQERK